MSFRERRMGPSKFGCAGEERNPAHGPKLVSRWNTAHVQFALATPCASSTVAITLMPIPISEIRCATKASV